MRKSRTGSFLSLLALGIGLLAAGPPVAAEGDTPELPKGFGLSPAEAIEVCNPDGQHEYLARLRCRDGRRPSFERAGNVGSRNPTDTEDAGKRALEQMMNRKPLEPGEVDYHYVDRYEVECREGTFNVYLDMYHCDRPAPDEAPPGFTIVDMKKKG